MRNKNLFNESIYVGRNLLSNEDFKMTTAKAARLNEQGVCCCGICRRLYMIDIFDQDANMLECDDCFKAMVRRAVNGEHTNATHIKA